LNAGLRRPSKGVSQIPSCAVSRVGWRTSDCLSPERDLRGMIVDGAWAGFTEGGVTGA
jgi:hypothetical protein